MKHLAQSDTQTYALGEKLAQNLQKGAVELVGDVGAGKTTFVKGLARGLGISEAVTSPTFTISQVYSDHTGPRLYHYDFYRLEDPGLMRYELAGSLSDESALTVVEWAENVRDVLPGARVTVTITAVSETRRQIEIKGIKW